MQKARQGLLLKPEFLAGDSRVDPNPESFKWDDLHLLQSQQVSLAVRLSTLKWVLVKAWDAGQITSPLWLMGFLFVLFCFGYGVSSV